MAGEDLIRKAIFQISVEADPSPGAKETADTIRAITAAEKEGQAQAAGFEAAHRSAMETAARSQPVYDATAAKMRTMFQVIRDGTKNVLAYTALDGTLRKLDATFRTTAGGAVTLQQDLADVGKGAVRAGGDLEELKRKAATLAVPAVQPATPTVATAPTAADGGSLANNAIITELALQGVSEEAREMAAELLKAGAAGQASFNELNAAALAELRTLEELVNVVKQTAEPGSALLSGELTAAQAEAIDLLVTMGAIKEENRGTVEEATKILNAQAAISAQADATAKKYEEQRGILDQLGSRVDLLKQKRGSITDPAELARTNDELDRAKAAYDALANSTAEAFNTQPIEEAVGILDQYASRVELLKQRRVSVTDPEELAKVNDLLGEAQARYNAIATASASASDAATAGLTEQIGVLEQYASRVKLLEQKRISVTDPEQLAKANDELGEARAAYEAVATASAKANDPSRAKVIVQTYTSLRTQLQEAKAKLDQLVESSNGKLTPEIIAAATAAGQLQDRFEDVNATVNAFNPDKKFQVLTGLVQNSLGAFTALQGAMALVGVEGEAVEKSLLKVQSALAVTQGLQALFGGLRDNLRNLRLQFLAAATNARALYAAELQAAAGASAQGAATSGLTGALVRARAASVAFFQSMLANPVILAMAVALVAVAGAMLFFQNRTEDAKETVDDFFDNLEARSQQADENRRFREAQALIQAEIDLLKTKGTEEDKLANTRQENAVKELSAIEAIRIAEEEVNAALKRRGELQKEALDQSVAAAELGATGLGRERDPEADAVARKQAAADARAAFDFRKDATEEQLADELRINEEIAKGIAEQDKLRKALALQRKQGEKDELAAVKAVADARAAAAKKAAEEAAKIPLSGSIAAFQKELDKLKAIANNIPLDAFESGVVGSIREAIRKAEADLAQAQALFADVAVETLNERQRQALAIADIEAKAAAAQRVAIGTNAEQIAIAEKEATDKRFAILVEFEQDRLKLMVDSGKATETELIAQRNKIAELQRLRTVTGSEGINAVDTARTARLTAELEEQRRHELALLDVSIEGRTRAAIINGDGEEELRKIDEEGDRQRLVLEIEFQKKLLDVMVQGGLAIQQEVTAARNRLKELLAKFALPTDTATGMRELVDDIVSGAEQIANAGIQAWAAWSKAEENALDRSLDIQRQRVEDAKELAQNGNVVLLEEEKKRLRELLRERQKAAEQNAAIAQAEATAQAIVAIARAASEGGALAAVTIAATLIALGAGFVSARQLTESAVPSYFKGGEADWSRLGGYTGDGHPAQRSTAVGRKPYNYEHREFIMDHATTGVGNNKQWFERILRGRVNLDHLMQPRAFVTINPPGGMNKKDVDRLVNAIRDIPENRVTFDQNGVTMMIRSRQRRQDIINSRR